MVNSSITAEDIKSRAYGGMNEENVCTRLVVPYFTGVLGWSINDIYAEYRVHESHGKMVDYALPNDKDPNFLIEVKSLGTNLQNEIDQLSEYLYLANVDYGLLTDGINYMLIERSEVESNNIRSQFKIIDQPPDLISCNQNVKTEDRSSIGFFQDIPESATHHFPYWLIDPICIQYESRLDKIEPIHMYLCMDIEMSSGIREFVLNQYEDIVYIKNNGRSEEFLRNSSDPNILVFDNVTSNQTVNDHTISRAFDSIIIDDVTRLPKHKPLIIIDVPESGRWNEFDPVPAQIRLEKPILSDIDLVYAPEDTQTEERDMYISNRYFEGNEWSLSDTELEIEPESNICNREIQEEAREYISEFFVSIRSSGVPEGSVPVTPEVLNTLEKIMKSVASAECSNTVEKRHAECAKEIVMASLKNIGYDEEAGRFDVDMTEPNQSTSQRERRNTLIKVIEDHEDEGDKGAPKDLVLEIMTEEYDFREDKVDHDWRKMVREGKEIYEIKNGESRVL
jgi:hypothetical protein